MLPLDNVAILDLTTRAPGPFCSMVLADLGANVILIEAPAGVLSMDKSAAKDDPAREAAYDPLRRSKRSIVLNLKHKSGQEVFQRLAKSADVVMEGFRPGVVNRLGIGYEAIKRTNPRIVYCSISGYGQDGPYRDLPGHDVNYISIAGVLSLIGTRDGQPVIPYNLLADFASGGYLSALTILTALWARERTGQGQYLDMSLTDGALYLLADSVGSYYRTGELPRPGAMRLNGAFPDYSPYRCKDGKYLTIGSLEQKFWDNTCNALGRPDLIPKRNTEPGHVRGELAKIFATRTRDEWFAFFADKDVCAGKVNMLNELAADPQVQARKMMIEVPGPDGKPIKQVGIAAHLRGTPGKVRAHGLPPGASTREVLTGAGYAPADIKRLYREGAVA